jgi:protein PhnA
MMSEQCALSGDTCDQLIPFEVIGGETASITICAHYQQQMNGETEIVPNQWRFLGDAIWSQQPAVQVVAYRMLHRLADMGEAWAQEILDAAYLEEEIKAWAEAGLSSAEDDDDPKPRDSNGMTLQEGDSVTLIKDLEVKGANFTAKRGTLVKNIHLTNNPKHIEGKVNGTTIVLVTAYLKKA